MVKFSSLLAGALSVLASAVSSQSNPPQPQTKYFTQILDHFNPQDTRTFQEQYLVYDGYYQGGDAPIFFYAGNEGAVGDFYNNTGFMFDIAPAFGALIIFAEHRYYGASLPFGEDSFQTSNLRYLTVELAVADYANLLTTLKQQMNIEDAPIVVFGGSYGGILAAACRIHYPSIFHAALAASAPVPQTLNTVDPLVFFKLVTQDYYNVDPSCPDIARQGFAAIIEAGEKEEYEMLTETFNLCDPLESSFDVEYLQLWARNGYLTMAMVDYPYAADFLGSLPAWPVNVSCDLMIDNQASPLQAIAESAGLYYNASEEYTLECFNITKEFVLCADQTGCGTGPEARSWDYQMCTEIVYGQDTNNVTDMFPPRVWELSNLTDYCQNKYGVTPNPEWMQLWYPLDVGGATSRVIWSNGLLDPWHGGGYMTSPGPDQPTVILPSGAHHLDLRGPNPDDPDDVTQARKQEQNQIRAWLDGYYRELHQKRSSHGKSRSHLKFKARRFTS